MRKPKRKKVYQNPVYKAMEWQKILDEKRFKSKAALGRYLGVTRVRVIQVLGLLKLSPEVINKVSALGETFTGKIIGEKTLRPFICLTLSKQMEKLNSVLC